MGRIPEASISQTLAALRLHVDQGSKRLLDDGRLVADIVPGDQKIWSLNRFLSEVTRFSQGTISNHVSVLVRAGFVEAGMVRGTTKRWVVLEGEFRYEDFEK